jgi:hypothetical protein
VKRLRIGGSLPMGARETRETRTSSSPSPPPAELFVLHPRTQEGNPLMARKVIRIHTHRQDLSLSLS